MDPNFPSRDELKNRQSTLQSTSYRDDIVSAIKDIDVSNVDFSQGDFKPRSVIAEKQKVYFWIRLYLKDESKNLQQNDDIVMKYVSSGEELEAKFICFAKQNDKQTDSEDEEVVNYNPEDDTRVLCLMVDSERIDSNSEDIPFIRTLFRISKYYEYQLLKLTDITFTNKRTGESLDYYDVDF